MLVYVNSLVSLSTLVWQLSTKSTIHFNDNKPFDLKFLFLYLMTAGSRLNTFDIVTYCLVKKRCVLSVTFQLRPIFFKITYNINHKIIYNVTELIAPPYGWSLCVICCNIDECHEVFFHNS